MMRYDDERVWVLLRYMFVVCTSWYIQKKKKIWMDGDGYRGKDTRPHTGGWMWMMVKVSMGEWCVHWRGAHIFRCWGILSGGSKDGKLQRKLYVESERPIEGTEFGRRLGWKKVLVVMVGVSQVQRIGDKSKRKYSEKIEIVWRVRVEGQTWVKTGEGVSFGFEHGRQDGHGGSGWTHMSCETCETRWQRFQRRRMVKVKRRTRSEEEWEGDLPHGESCEDKYGWWTRWWTFLWSCELDNGAKVSDSLMADWWGGLDVNREIRVSIVNRDVDIETVEWWMLTNSKHELKLTETRQMLVIGKENVHS
jgi:hypothetical protein